MGTVAEAARKLVEQTSRHRVISVYLDLDPERFATAQARASQIRSLIDEAKKWIESEHDVDHEERVALRDDVQRVDRYLTSGEAPIHGARALAVFCSGLDGLFEAVPIARRVDARVVIERSPYIEPMVAVADERLWCVVLVNRRVGRILTGPADRLAERQRVEDNVHGQHDQGGWSQPRYERSIEKEADDHLRHVAEIVYRSWQRERFARIALGGPEEIVPRFESMLHDDLRPYLVPERVEVDVGSSSEDQVRGAARRLVERDERRHERELLDRLAEAIGAGGRGAGGPQATATALNERRVQALLLAPDFDRSASRCPACGMLLLDGNGTCPGDGSALEPVGHLREAAVESAIAQDAQVMVVRSYSDLGPLQGIAALLRF